mmetsp:Transcript_10278/g.23177  ORF Transcript_10278/g.23177 Transcript_10278/m.23177 type:complete len:286 (+) Transcript_10278:85-942(+)
MLAFALTVALAGTFPTLSTATAGNSSSSSTTTVITSTTSAVPTSTTINADCTSLIYHFHILLEHVDVVRDDYQTKLAEAIGSALLTSPTCVILAAPIRGQGRRLADLVSQIGYSGVAPGTTQAQVTSALSSSSFQTDVCSSLGMGPRCAVQNVTVVTGTTTITATTTGTTVTGGLSTTTTTTSEMPWGLPWWGWLLICLGLLLCCALCALPAAGAPLAMGGKKKNKAPHPPTDQEIVHETEYHVVEEPLLANTAGAAPMATSTMVYPTGTTGYYPTATMTTSPYV